MQPNQEAFYVTDSVIDIIDNGDNNFSLGEYNIGVKHDVVSDERGYFTCPRDSIFAYVDMVGDSEVEAAYNKNIEKIIKCPKNLDSIKHICFYGCENLKSINIPTTVKTIGALAFSVCAFTSVNIPNGVTETWHNVFEYCPNLTSATIPSSITIGRSGLFRRCKGLYNGGIKYLGLSNPKFGYNEEFDDYGDWSFIIGNYDPAYKYDPSPIHVPSNYVDDSFCGYDVVKDLPAV